MNHIVMKSLSPTRHTVQTRRLRSLPDSKLSKLNQMTKGLVDVERFKKCSERKYCSTYVDEP